MVKIDKASLRLLAHDEEDLKAIAAITQDALVPVSDMAWLASEKRFVLAMNRFRWETAYEAADGIYERTNSGLCFEQVVAVQLRGLDLKQRDFMLDLLTIVYVDGHVRLSFAGDRDIRLKVAALDCRLDDFGEPWPTRTRPRHALEAEWREWQSAVSD